MGWNAHLGGVAAVCLSVDETSVFTLGQDGSLDVWSMHKIGQRLRSFALPAPTLSESMGTLAPSQLSSVSGIAMDPDGRHFCVCHGPSLFVFDVNKTDAVQEVVSHRAAATCVAWHPTRSELLVSGGADSSVCVHHMEPRRIDGGGPGADASSMQRGESAEDERVD